MTTITQQATSQIQAFTQATAEMDLSGFMAPEIGEKINQFPLKDQYRQYESLQLPQFVLTIEHTSLFGDDTHHKLLEKEDCLTGFQLNNQDTNISFDAIDSTVYMVDVQGIPGKQFAPESSKLSQKASKSFMSYLATQTDDGAKKSVANLIMNNLRRLDHLNEKDLK